MYYDNKFKEKLYDSVKQGVFYSVLMGASLLPFGCGGGGGGSSGAAYTTEVQLNEKVIGAKNKWKQDQGDLTGKLEESEDPADKPDQKPDDSIRSVIRDF